LIKSYRAIHQWNHWLNHFLGSALLSAEHDIMLDLLRKNNGKNALLIGVPKQYSLLQDSTIPNRLLLTPLALHDKTIRYIESDWSELPIHSGSVDLVVLPHTLEHTDNPRQILSEACRIVKPEGSLIIFGFNPYSLWGLRKKWDSLQDHAPLISKGHFLSSSAIKQWLGLADFELTKQKTFFFRPPLTHQALFQRLKIMEWIGNKSHLPLGGVYVLMAKAKVIPLTPIRLHWKQPLASAKLSIPGPNVRNYTF